MALSVHVASLTRSHPGKATAIVVIRPSKSSGFLIEFVFDDEGSDENNLHYVQGALQRFSHSLGEAFKQPLKIAPKPAARE